MRRIENELSDLRQQRQNLDIDCDDDDASEDSDSGETENIDVAEDTGGAAAAATTTTTTSLTPDEYSYISAAAAATPPQLSAAEHESKRIVEEARKRSQQKKRELRFKHEMQLPSSSGGGAAAARQQPQTSFTVSAKTASFINMVYGFGEKRINNYDVPAAEAVFKELGLVESDKHMHWEYTDAEGIIHKLSFHTPHGRCENKLYLAIRTRIKRFFERVGISPETVVTG